MSLAFLRDESCTVRPSMHRYVSPLQGSTPSKTDEAQVRGRATATHGRREELAAAILLTGSEKESRMRPNIMGSQLRHCSTVTAGACFAAREKM